MGPHLQLQSSGKFMITEEEGQFLQVYGPCFNGQLAVHHSHMGSTNWTEYKKKSRGFETGMGHGRMNAQKRLE